MSPGKFSVSLCLLRHSFKILTLETVVQRPNITTQQPGSIIS